VLEGKLTMPHRWMKPFLLIASLTAAVMACKNVSSPTAPSLSTVAITGNSSLTSIGQTSQLTAVATLSDGTSQQNVTTTATWQSSSPAVATVSNAGLVTAVAAGTTTITATYQAKSGTFNVTVTIAPAPFSSLAGTWVGTWNDNIYNVSGSLTATFAVTGSTVSATGVIGLGVFGMSNEGGTGVGTISGQTLNFTFVSSTVGSGMGTLASGGAGSGSGTVTPPLSFGAFKFSGTVTGTTISGTFTFTSPTGGAGVASLTKQ
jgi:Bacterial Ig-like domain (group 2)